MLNSHLWDEIAKAALVCPQFICLGDFKQFSACADTYAGSPVNVSLEDSDLLRQLCGSQRLQLTGNRRSDPTLFAFYTSITEDFHETLRTARLQFPKQSGIPRYSLAISHATRLAVNRKYNLHDKIVKLNAVPYKAQPSLQDNKPQSFWAGGGGPPPPKKGLFYTVVSATPERLVLEGHGETLGLAAETADKCLRLSHCITYAS